MRFYPVLFATGGLLILFGAGAGPDARPAPRLPDEPGEAAPAPPRESAAPVDASERSGEPRVVPEEEPQAPEPPPGPPLPPPPGFTRAIGPGPDVRGDVVDEDGLPVREIRVFARTWKQGRGCYRPMFRAGEAREVGGGRFTFHTDAEAVPDVPPWVRGEIFTVAAEGFLEQTVELPETEWASLLEGVSVDVTVVLVRAAAIEGTVRGPDGDPVEGARVTLTLTDSKGPGARSDRTGPRGGFRFDGLRPGASGWLIARAEDAESPPAPVSGLAEQGTQRFDLDLEPATPVDLEVVLSGLFEGGTLLLDGGDEVPAEPSRTWRTRTGRHTVRLLREGRETIERTVRIPTGRLHHRERIAVD